MHIRQSDFNAPKNQTRHYRLFELMRQTNVCAGANRKAQQGTDGEMAVFRDMATASLRF